MRNDDFRYRAPIQEPDYVSPIVLPLVILVLTAEIGWHLCQTWGWFR